MSLYDSEGTGTDVAVDPEELLRKKLAQMPPAPMPQQQTSIDALARNPQNLLMPAAPMPQDAAATQSTPRTSPAFTMPPAGIPGAPAVTNQKNTLTMPAATTPATPRDDNPPGSGASSVPRGAQMPAATPISTKPDSAGPTGHYEGDVWHPDLKQRSDAAATPSSAVSSDLVTRAMQSASGGANPARNYAQDYDALLRQEPNRADFPANKMPFWKKALGLAFAGAAGYGRNDDTTYELARKILNGPRAAADDKFNAAEEAWKNKVRAVQTEAGLDKTGAETREANLRANLSQRQLDTPKPDKPEDQKIGEYTNDEGHPTFVFRKPTGEIYENSVPGSVKEKSDDTSESTPFKLWRQQHPNADVKEYFKLQPEARNEARPPKETARLTPGQKASITSRYKQSLSDIEDEFQSRQSGSYVDRRSGELLPPMTQAELNRKKQQAENSYKDELEAAGEPNVTRFNYSTGRNDSEGAQPQGAANPAGSAQGASKQSGATQHQVGDIVTYQGKQHRITAIRNGKADLVPVTPGQ